MTPSHARKGGLKYRYYLSSALQAPARERANSGLFAKSREISVRPGLRGGGRSLCRTRLSNQIPC
jgi:hypothetical protein